MSADTMTSSTCRLVHYKSHVQGLILALKKHNQDRRSRCFHGSSSAGDGGTTGGNDADGGGEEGEAGETETEVKCATLICKVTVTNCSSSSHRARCPDRVKHKRYVNKTKYLKLYQSISSKQTEQLSVASPVRIRTQILEPLNNTSV